MTDDTSETGEGIAYSSETDTHRVEFTQTAEGPSAAIVTAVAAIAGRKQDDLDPLYSVVDPDALDSLFEPTANGGHRGDVDVSFTYQGYDIAVHSYGIIEITPAAMDRQ